jgi:Rieske 2Fe-2S family protein
MVPAPLDAHSVERVVAPFGTSMTLPAAAYLSDDVLAWERAHLWSGAWVCVGRLDELLAPGQARAVQVGVESVLVTRTQDGVVNAYSNTCRHRGHELAPVGEAFDARLIRCPYHSWTYRFDGSLRSAPTFSQSEDFDPADYPLVGVGVDSWHGWLFVDLSGTAGPLVDQFGNLDDLLGPYEPERLVEMARHDYVVDANWKVVVENYNECYHCSSIHPALCEVTPPDSGKDVQPTGVWCGGMMRLKDHAETMSFDGASGGVRLRGVDDARSRDVYYVTVIPNLLVSAHPDYVMTHRLTPLTTTTTAVECAWLFPPEARERPGFDPAYAVDFWDVTNREDWAACQAVQRGIANRGYRPGPLSRWEGTVYQFLGIIARAYRGEGLVVPVLPVEELR